MNEESPLNQLTYARITIKQLWHYLPYLLWSSFIFSGLSLPAVSLFVLGLWLPAIIVGVLTIMPGWVAVLAYEANLVQELKTDLAEIFKAFYRYWSRSILFGMLTAFPVIVAWLTLPALGQPQIPMIVWIGLAADFFGLLLLFALLIYAAPLMVLFNLSVTIALQNAFILAGRYLFNTLGILSLGILCGLSIIFLSLGLIFILPVMWSLFVINNCRLVVSLEEQKHDV